MTDVFVGSKEKSQTSRGTNQDQTGSWTKEKSLAPIPNVSVPNPTTPNANASDDNQRLSEIMGHPVKGHAAMPPRSASSGSPGGTVPSANVRASETDGVGRPVKR